MGPSIGTGEHHLSERGMRGQLRQCRSEAVLMLLLLRRRRGRAENNFERGEIPIRGGGGEREKQISRLRLHDAEVRTSGGNSKSGFASRLSRAAELSAAAARPTLTEEQLSGAHLSSAPALLHRQ